MVRRITYRIASLFEQWVVCPLFPRFSLICIRSIGLEQAHAQLLPLPEATHKGGKDG